MKLPLMPFPSSDKALILLSGGMDSAVLLASAAATYPYIHCLSFDYGSKHNAQELSCALALGEFYEADKHTFVDLSFMQDFQSSLLKEGPPIPHGHYEDETMKSTVVPFRNGILLSIAVGMAESLQIPTVLYAAHAGDHAIYPDCRQTFVSFMHQAAYHGTYNHVHIAAPFLFLSKRDIAIKGKELGVDFANTWSCYEGGTHHCGECGTCVERREALQGFDPTIYAHKGDPR